MIRVLLNGGLGNQMFQYAAARAISVASNRKVLLDASFLEQYNFAKNVTRRKNELKVFDMNICFDQSIWTSKWLFKYNYIALASDMVRRFLNKETIIEPDSIDSIEQISDGNILIKSVSQKKIHFDKIRNIIVKDFNSIAACQTVQYKNYSSLIHKSADPTVSIHIRRGDYLFQKNKEFHGVLPISYYENALNLIKKKVGNVTVCVFSDDIEYCKTIGFNAKKLIYIEDQRGGPVVDILLMKACDHNIIANSSFSWWGAYLNTNVDKIVIAPMSWFANDIEGVAMPPEWIKL